MGIDQDPYRTLGLDPGASAEEVRRAYRRLAKANHPDSAGEGALPRFLAIQAAYETLIGPRAVRRPGARPGASSAPPPRPEPRPGAGPRASRRPRPGSAAGPGASGGPGPSGTGPRSTAGGAGSGGPGGANASAGSRRSGRRRAPNRATPGSTSYDTAEDEPLDPGWSGATWYGASSGTYWTINPKEYADPRKHGPEYQRRARRSSDGADPTGDDASGAPFPPPAEAAATDAGWSSPPRRAGAADPAADRPRAGRDRASGPSAPPGDASRAAPGAEGPAQRAEPGDRPSERSWIALRQPSGPSGRLWLALAGWPPLGVALATAVGETSGCGRFAASCVELFGVGTWIAQLALIVLLLAIPRLAAISAVGSLAVLAAAAPTAVVLSATGGARQPDASAAVLLVVLGIAYVVGVAIGVGRQLRASGRARLP